MLMLPLRLNESDLSVMLDKLDLKLASRKDPFMEDLPDTMESFDWLRADLLLERTEEFRLAFLLP